jgi:hypothetical protein
MAGEFAVRANEAARLVPRRGPLVGKRPRGAGAHATSSWHRGEFELHRGFHVQAHSYCGHGRAPRRSGARVCPEQLRGRQACRRSRPRSPSRGHRGVQGQERGRRVRVRRAARSRGRHVSQGPRRRHGVLPPAHAPRWWRIAPGASADRFARPSAQDRRGDPGARADRDLSLLARGRFRPRATLRRARNRNHGRETHMHRVRDEPADDRDELHPHQRHLRLATDAGGDAGWNAYGRVAVSLVLDRAEEGRRLGPGPDAEDRATTRRSRQRSPSAALREPVSPRAGRDAGRATSRGRRSCGTPPPA